jgi:hypothetical protein
VGLFSGRDFTVDATEGLNGICDFLLSRSPHQFFIEAPVLAIVEAKEEDIPSGLGQCAASMVAAQRFNEQESTSLPAVYGAVTTGDIWRFLRLEGNTLSLDAEQYYLDQRAKILGILLHIVT